MNREYDLVIVGGGMVGAALACALVDQSLSVALVEANPPGEFSAGQPHDLRVSAISPASQHFLENIGAWSGVQSRRLCPYRRMRVWESDGLGDTLFDSDDIDQPVLGHIVENSVIQQALWERLGSAANVQILTEAVEAIHYRAEMSDVLLADGATLRARLLVGADGGGSRVRQAAGIGVHSWDYRQHALVAYVETDYPQQNITWQKFVPTGPLAFLPLTGPFASLVWYQTPEEVNRLLTLDDEAFLEELYLRFPAELGTLKRLIRRASFPLKRQHALHYVKPGLALVGDAVHMIHPLAGQGVNIGLLDAAVLAEQLIDSLSEGGSPGALPMLQAYEQLRRQHNLAVMTAMDLFYRVFGRREAPVRWLRNLGLAVAQRLGPAKKRAMRYAMGLEGELPGLATSKRGSE